jgi:hypothetical protein
MSQGERALQVENNNAFAFPLFDVQTHALTEHSASLNQPDYHYYHGDD